MMGEISDDDYLRFAARLVTGTLLDEVKRADGPGGGLEGSIDPERIPGTSFLAGRKVFGDRYTPALVEDAIRWCGDDDRCCLDRLAKDPLFPQVKAGCSARQKDAIILAALTALELNIDNIGAELFNLRAFGHRLYDTPAESDRRIILYGEAGVSLYPQAICLVNEIVRELNNASVSAPGAAAALSRDEARPARHIGIGLLILIVSALIAIGAIGFGARTIDDPPAWLAVVGAGLSVAFYFGIYRGFRLLTGAGRWASAALTVFGFPLLFAGLLFAIGELLPQEGRSAAAGMRATGPEMVSLKQKAD